MKNQMNIKKHVPNMITLGNLFSGIIAVFYAVFGNFKMVALFVSVGIVFDFFDGFIARLLKVQGALGKQLDSLADVVTSGIVPGIVMFQMLLHATTKSEIEAVFSQGTVELLPFVGFLIALASAYRLAKFNIDTRQTESFIGLPVPANTLWIVSLPLILEYNNAEFVKNLLENKNVLLGLTVLSAYLLNAEIHLFALKFKTFSWKENAFKYLFLLVAILLLSTVKFMAVPLIVFLYVLVSVVQKRNHVL
jgi:CDP-diacylglycerol--serine O-phosphatidyltransferase